MGYPVKWEKDGNRIYGDGTEIRLAVLDKQTGCGVATMDTEVKQGEQKQKLFPVLPGRYMGHGVAGILKVAREMMKDVHAAELDNGDTADEERKAVGGNVEKIATAVLCASFVEMSFLAVWKRVLFGEYDNATWSCVGLLRGILPTG